jgi:hypothetical protein
MVVPSRLRTANAKLDQWFRNHVVIWWVVFATIPGGVYAVARLLTDGGSAFGAILHGGIFGVIFATITVVVQRRRRSYSSH